MQDIHQQKRQHPCITQCLKACIHASGLLLCFTADQRQNRRTAHKANRQCKQGQRGQTLRQQQPCLRRDRDPGKHGSYH